MRWRTAKGVPKSMGALRSRRSGSTWPVRQLVLEFLERVQNGPALTGTRPGAWRLPSRDPQHTEALLSRLLVDVSQSELVPERVPRDHQPGTPRPRPTNSQTQLALAEPFAPATRPLRPTRSRIPGSLNASKGKYNVVQSRLNQRLELRGQPRNVLDDPAQGYARPRPSVA